MTQDNRIWVLISRRLSGEATSAEVDELQRLLAQAPDKQYLFSILHAYFDKTPEAPADTEEDPGWEERFRRIVETAPPDETPAVADESACRLFRLPRFIAYSAAAAILILLGWGIWLLLPHRTAAPLVHTQSRSEEILARPGARTRLLLPDGTQVWLNSNSRLKYSNEFNIKNSFS